MQILDVKFYLKTKMTLNSNLIKNIKTIIYIYIYIYILKKKKKKRKRPKLMFHMGEPMMKRRNIFPYPYTLYIYKRNDSYTHFSQQLHNKLTWLVIFYYFFYFILFFFCKNIIKYYQPRQLIVGLL